MAQSADEPLDVGSQYRRATSRLERFCDRHDGEFFPNNDRRDTAVCDLDTMDVHFRPGGSVIVNVPASGEQPTGTTPSIRYDDAEVQFARGDSMVPRESIRIRGEATTTISDRSD